jgi:hypothetical protein
MMSVSRKTASCRPNVAKITGMRKGQRLGEPQRRHRRQGQGRRAAQRLAGVHRIDDRDRLGLEPGTRSAPYGTGFFSCVSVQQRPDQLEGAIIAIGVRLRAGRRS